MNSLVGPRIAAAAVGQSPGARHHAGRDARDAEPQTSFGALVAARAKPATPAAGDAKADGHHARPTRDAGASADKADLGLESDAETMAAGAESALEGKPALDPWALATHGAGRARSASRASKDGSGETRGATSAPGGALPLGLALHDLPRTIASSAEGKDSVDSAQTGTILAGKSAPPAAKDLKPGLADANPPPTLEAGSHATEAKSGKLAPATGSAPASTMPPGDNDKIADALVALAGPRLPATNASAAGAAAGAAIPVPRDGGTDRTSATTRTPAPRLASAPVGGDGKKVDASALQVPSDDDAPGNAGGTDGGKPGAHAGSADLSIGRRSLAASRGEAADAQAGANRPTLVSQQNFPAPAAHPVSQSTAAVLTAIAGNDGWRQAASSPSPAVTQPGTVAVAAQTLRIDLHPAELGTVSASLRLVGEQLSVELKPTTHEAYRRLSSDSDTIVKSLRSLGLSVDTVTVLQPAIAPHAAARADAQGTAAQMSGQNQSSFQAGGSGGRGADQGGQQPGRNGSNEASTTSQRHAVRGEAVDDSLFI